MRHNKWVNLSNFGTKTVLVPRLPSTRRIFFCLISRKSKRGSQEKKSHASEDKLPKEERKKRRRDTRRGRIEFLFLLCFCGNKQLEGFFSGPIQCRVSLASYGLFPLIALCWNVRYRPYYTCERNLSGIAPTGDVFTPGHVFTGNKAINNDAKQWVAPTNLLLPFLKLYRRRKKK